MTEHVLNPHTPAQDRLFSNIGHAIEGAIIAAAGALLVAAAIDDADRHDVRATRFLTGAGSVLGAALTAGSLHHGGPVAFFRADHQQRQHLEMAGWLTGLGVVRRWGRVGRFVSNGFVARVGQMFLTHEQHGTDEAARAAFAKHQLLGKTILGAAALGAAAEVSNAKPLSAASGIAMIAAGLQLLVYREPEGAYEAVDHAAGHHEPPA